MSKLEKQSKQVLKMSSEEEDYMSDKFLTDTGAKFRPGLVKHRPTLRENKVQAKKAKYDEETRKRNKATKVVERERREDGLSKSIMPDNKGFAMLAKMGYKEGQAIGKSAQGIVEPLGIKIKSDRCGLGRDTALRELNEMRRELLRKKAELNQNKTEISTEEFRKRFSQKHDMKMVESAIFKCQKVCERLDREDGILEPALLWFWPKREKQPADEDEGEEQEESEDEEEQYEPAEKLAMINNFLRTTYNYCQWCGVRYDDVTDLMENCPGPEKDNH